MRDIGRCRQPCGAHGGGWTDKRLCHSAVTGAHVRVVGVRRAAADLPAMPCGSSNSAAPVPLDPNVHTCLRSADGSIRSADGPSCKRSASAALARPFLQEQSVLRVPKVPKVLVYALAGECELLDAMIERVGHDDQPLALRDRLPRATVVARCLATILRHVPSLRLATPSAMP